MRHRRRTARTGKRAAALLSALLLAALLPGANAGSLEGELAPDFALKSMDGQNLRLSEYRGEVVLMNLWGSWCGKCRDQLAAIEQLRETYSDQNVAVLSVNLDRKLKKVRGLTEQLSLNFPILLDPRKQVARAYDPSRMPMTVVLDQSGTVRATWQGYKAGDTQLYMAELEQLLSEQTWN